MFATLSDGLLPAPVAHWAGGVLPLSSGEEQRPGLGMLLEQGRMGQLWQARLVFSEEMSF